MCVCVCVCVCVHACMCAYVDVCVDVCLCAYVLHPCMFTSKLLVCLYNRLHISQYIYYNLSKLNTKELIAELTKASG